MGKGGLTMQVEVSVTDVDEYTADDRGRITLGKDFAGKTVTVATLEVHDDE